MKSLYSFVAIAVLGIPVVAQGSTTVNLSATSSAGTSVTLAAGTYQVSVINGKYDGWDLTTKVDCSKTTNHWQESFDLILGNTSTTYSLAGDPSFASASAALSAYQNGILYKNNSTAASKIDDIAFFTVAPGETVKFEIPNAGRCDLSGGVSLSINAITNNAASAAPEPSTFGLMGLVLAGGVAAFRRKMGR